MFLDIILIGCVGSFAILVLLLKKQIGIAVLAALAGGFVAQKITPALTNQLNSNGIATEVVATQALVAISIILVPSLLAVIMSKKSNLGILNIFNAIIFGLVVMAVALPYLTGVFHSQLFEASNTDDLIAKYTNWIVGIGLLVSTGDMLVGAVFRGEKSSKHGQRH